jgi:integrase
VNNLRYLFNQAATTQSRTIPLLDSAIVLYKRPNSAQWQCRFRLDNGSWFAFTTASDQVDEASTRAIELHHGIHEAMPVMKFIEPELLRGWPRKN